MALTTLNAEQYFVRETLGDGTALTIRAVRPDIGAGLSAGKPTEIDYANAVVLLATIGASPPESAIGLGR